MRTLLAATLAAVLATSCAGPQRAEHKNLCEGSQTRCVAGDECSWDAERGCFFCVCRDPEDDPPAPDWLPERPGPPPPSP